MNLFESKVKKIPRGVKGVKVSLRQTGGLVIGYCQYVDNVMRKNKMKLYGRFYTKDIYKIIFL